jgi:hypothetical protein
MQFQKSHSEMTKNTKTWVVTLEIVVDENSHPRKFIPEAVSECLNLEEGEDITHYTFICLD